MAAITHLTASTDTTGGTSPPASSSFTPTAGRLLFAFVAASDCQATGDLAGSANGLTFTKVVSAVGGSGSPGNDSLYLYVANQFTPASPVSMTVSFDATGDSATGVGYMVGEVSGLTRVGTDAILQSKNADHTTGTPSITLDSAALTGNPTLFASVSLTFPSTPPTSWTERADTSWSTPNTGCAYSSRDSGFTGTTITSGSALGASCLIAAEFDTTSTGGSVGLVKSLNYDEGTDAADLTTASGYTTFSGTKATYSDDWFHQSSGLSMHVVTSSDNSSAQLNLATGVATPYRQDYYKIGALPTGSACILTRAFIGVGVTNAASYQLTTAGKFQNLDAGSASGSASSHTFAAGDVVRVAWKIEPGGATTLRMFWGANLEGTTPDETVTGTCTATGLIQQYRDGAITSTTVDYYRDDVDVSDSDWPAPRTSGTGPTTDGAEVYYWDAGSSDYVLATAVYDWRTGSSDYLPAADTDDVYYWSVTGSQYLPSGTVNPPVPGDVTMMMGCSSSKYDHGGTDSWPGWRVYQRSEMYMRANQSGTPSRPQFLLYSEAGAPMSGSYSSIRQHCLDELDAFYYGNAAGTLGTGQGSQTHSVRWDIKLYWSNGNENYEQSKIGAQTSANLTKYADSMRALYDAVHYIDPTTGQRRYPNAYAGSDPTQNQEQSGLVEYFLMPTAQDHDFIAWSMYPPGRGSTDTDPTYNWTTFDVADRNDLQDGFLLRCFWRTQQAMLQARTDTGDPTRSMIIACGEVGIASDPDDPVTRPYYAVYGLAGPMQQLADQLGLDIGPVCWWDSTKAAGGPHNVLSDEGSNSDHGNAGNPNPSTRVAWQNWTDYHEGYGGTKPASWSGTPKAGWKHTGTQLG